MDGIESLISKAVKAHILVPDGAPTPSITISKNSNFGFGESAEIPLVDIQNRLKTNLKFKLTVFTYVANSVGNGFHISADTSKPTGRKAKELIDDFNDTWDIDTMNQLIGRDVWSGGNVFLNAVESGENPIAALYHLPPSGFKSILRDDVGEVTEYKYSWGIKATNKSIKPKQILHWAWLPFDESAFGEGIGQAMERDGLGYETEGGTTVYRDSWFKTSEKIDDISSKMVYAGLPRFFGKFTGEGADQSFIDDATAKLNKLDPLQHFISNVEGSIETVALDTSNRFDSFMRHLDDQMVHGTMSPLIRLWSSLNFTFASSKEAVDAMLPFVGMYQRAHKRFMERMVYNPILVANNYDVKKANVKLNWGKQEPLKIEEIKEIFEMIKDPALIDKFNPDDFLDMLREVGVPLTKVAKEEVATINKLRNVIGRSDTNKTIKMRLVPPAPTDPMKKDKQKLMNILKERYNV